MNRSGIELWGRAQRLIGRLEFRLLDSDMAVIEELAAAYLELLLSAGGPTDTITAEPGAEAQGLRRDQIAEIAEPPAETSEPPTESALRPEAEAPRADGERTCIRCRDPKVPGAFRKPAGRICHDCEKLGRRAKGAAKREKLRSGQTARPHVDNVRTDQTCTECGGPSRGKLCHRCTGRMGGLKKKLLAKADAESKPVPSQVNAAAGFRRYRDHLGQVWYIDILDRHRGEEGGCCVWKQGTGEDGPDCMLAITDNHGHSKRAAQTMLDTFAATQPKWTPVEEREAV
jgi:hypothetical protein